MLNRRGLITGLISLVAAPAIIRVNHLMPISVPKLETFSFDIESYCLDDLLPYSRRNIIIVGRDMYDAYKQAMLGPNNLRNVILDPTYTMNDEDDLT